MIVDAGFLDQWAHKGHRYGECMSHPRSELMYVNIPKNASSWTKPNLQDWNWEFYNYHYDTPVKHKTPIVVLRDPVERWISGIAEYFALYFPNFSFPSRETYQLVLDKITFDDHTEKQVNFIHGLDTDKCIFLWCDENYRTNFSNLVREHLGDNKYDRYEYQHVSSNDTDRKYFKETFSRLLTNPKYLEQVKQHFAQDYSLIESVKFYGTR